MKVLTVIYIISFITLCWYLSNEKPHFIVNKRRNSILIDI